MGIDQIEAEAINSASDEELFKWGLPTEARARHSDPPTSHAAAKSVGDLTPNQRAVMTVLRISHKPLLDEELISNYEMQQEGLRLPRQSDSGIRSRRAELAATGLIVEADKRRMTTGRMGRTWSVRMADGNDS